MHLVSLDLLLSWILYSAHLTLTCQASWATQHPDLWIGSHFGAPDCCQTPVPQYSMVRLIDVELVRMTWKSSTVRRWIRLLYSLKASEPDSSERVCSSCVLARWGPQWLDEARSGVIGTGGGFARAIQELVQPGLRSSHSRRSCQLVRHFASVLDEMIRIRIWQQLLDDFFYSSQIDFLDRK